METIKEQSDNQDRLNLGMLLLIDSMNRVKMSTDNSSIGLSGIVDALRMSTRTAGDLTLGLNQLSTAAKKSRTRLDERTKLEAVFKQNVANIETGLIRGGQALSAAASQFGGEIDLFPTDSIKDLKKWFKESGKAAKENSQNSWFAAKEQELIAQELASLGASIPKGFGEKLKGFGDKMKAGGKEALGGIKSGIVGPLKAIPMQIGAILIRPLTRLVDPFMTVLEDLTLITEPIVGLFEIFLAPLQEVIGVFSGSLANAIFGNESLMNSLTTAGETFATSLGSMDAVIDTVVGGLIIMAEGFHVITGMFDRLINLDFTGGSRLDLLNQLAGNVTTPDPGAIDPGAVSGSGSGHRVTNITVLGNVTSDREIGRMINRGFI